MKPTVLVWFKVYCGILAALYLLLILIYLLIDSNSLEMEALEAQILGWIFIGISIPLFIVSILPFLLKPKPWVWIYDLVIICIGMTSGCFLPICIPLLIFWIKPETQAYFRR
jgi:hypothetical protein